MKLVVFGLSLSSSWGNGHATSYRALLGAFAARGHDITFYEWNAPWYQGAHRDLTDPDFCRHVLYDEWGSISARAVAEAREADATLVGSYVHGGAALIDALAAARVEPLFFYDIDTPVTVAALRGAGTEYLRADQIPWFTRYLSLTGGPFLVEVLEAEFGARDAQPLYCSVDPERYARAQPDPELGADLAYMGTYAADRQPAVERFLLEPAMRLPRRSFLIAGPQYPEAEQWPGNVRHLDHLPPERHAAFYSTADWQLNVTRADMVAAGWSPSVRLFEAGACGAAVISDSWAGIGELFEPGREILLPQSAEETVGILAATHPDDRRALGEALRTRILREHTAERRAAEFEALLVAPAAVA